MTTDFALEHFRITEKDNLDPGRNSIIERKDYDMTVYLCNPLTRKRVYTKRINQGEVRSICSEIENPEVAAREGIVLGRIDYFFWNRDNGIFNPTQHAVQDGVGSNDGLSFCDCKPGSTICTMQSEHIPVSI